MVAFSKKDLYSVSRELEKRGIDAALIYGSLPPDVKMSQAENFNDPNHPCNVLVATDAIGMGLNLNIQRVIFHSMTKPTLLENGLSVCFSFSLNSRFECNALMPFIDRWRVGDNRLSRKNVFTA